MREPVDLDGIEARCGFTTIALDGTEEPCDRPAPSWRWYQGHEHEDCLDRACIVHENPGGIRMAALVAEVRALRARLEEVNDYADTMVRGKSLWMALDLRTITAGMRVVFTPDADTNGEPAP